MSNGKVTQAIIKIEATIKEVISGHLTPMYKAEVVCELMAAYKKLDRLEYQIERYIETLEDSIERGNLGKIRRPF